MFYHTPKGERITIVNKRPINLSRGGLIPRLPNIPQKHMDEDTILSDLEVGSLVVPVSVMKSGIMKEYDGETTGPIQTNKKKLTRAVVMPYEGVINKKYAPKVEQFLRKRGIRLPLGS